MLLDWLIINSKRAYFPFSLSFFSLEIVGWKWHVWIANGSRHLLKKCYGCHVFHMIRSEPCLFLLTCHRSFLVSLLYDPIVMSWFFCPWQNNLFPSPFVCYRQSWRDTFETDVFDDAQKNPNLCVLLQLALIESIRHTGSTKSLKVILDTQRCKQATINKPTRLAFPERCIGWSISFEQLKNLECLLALWMAPPFFFKKKIHQLLYFSGQGLLKKEKWVEKTGWMWF